MLVTGKLTEVCGHSLHFQLLCKSKTILVKQKSSQIWNMVYDRKNNLLSRLIKHLTLLLSYKCQTCCLGRVVQAGSPVSETLGPVIISTQDNSSEQGWTYVERTSGRGTCQPGEKSWDVKLPDPAPKCPPFGFLPALFHCSLVPLLLLFPQLYIKSDWMSSRSNTKLLRFWNNAV